MLWNGYKYTKSCIALDQKRVQNFANIAIFVTKNALETKLDRGGN